MLVLCYHKFNNSGIFKEHLNFLFKRYKIISANEFKLRINCNDNFDNDELLLTFDDGDKSIYLNASQGLKKFKIPAIVFITTSLIDTHKPFWWDEIDYYSGNPMEKWRVKTIPNVERLGYLENLRKNSNKPQFFYNQLTTSDLYQLQDDGISVASHTHSHPILDQCTNIEVQEELQKSRSFIKNLGLPHYDLFAYPNGNYNEYLKQQLRINGYKAAFIFDHQPANHITDLLSISRLSVTDTTPLWKLQLILSGWHSKIVHLRRKWGI